MTEAEEIEQQIEEDWKKCNLGYPSAEIRNWLKHNTGSANSHITGPLRRDAGFAMWRACRERKDAEISLLKEKYEGEFQLVERKNREIDRLTRKR